ncbi:hypothetical protein O181_070484 [Austropuccinia psidii MF-1]|uniref:Uncharacterized protein n=1 Tax=Austropuccinia psidii MF-1 TaxID=1389203 RepID=A0A9Q3I9J2_9BASI|nr:hypothetical protein [Austropuccinia psidii MF-1]
MNNIVPQPEPKVSTSANDQGYFLSRIAELGESLSYNSNITQESFNRVIDNINNIYKNKWDSLQKNDVNKFLTAGIKVINNQELEISAWLEELDIESEFYLCE